MKQIQPNGLPVIVPALTFGKKRGKFDPWTAHGDISLVIEHQVCASGDSCWTFSAVLVDGSKFTYLYIPPQFDSSGFPALLSYAQYRNPGTVSFKTGESFNHILRHQLITKFTPAEFAIFLASH